MQMATPRAMQGTDIIQISYGWHEGDFYRRTFDQSDRSERWYVADELSTRRLAGECYEPGGAVHAPDVNRWTPCDEPECTTQSLPEPGSPVWAQHVKPGDYLARYENLAEVLATMDGSRCGYSDADLALVRVRLGSRGLTIKADDKGLVVVRVAQS